jgi:hypothetical protein
MSSDLDDVLRASMRRHAEQAPTQVDLQRVHERADAIKRRRTLDAILAVAATVVVATGVGLLLHNVSTQDRTPPPTISGALPWIARTSLDVNAQPTGAIRVIARVNGSDQTMATVPSKLAQVLGWYGPERRTLVWSEGSESGLRERTLYSATFAADGTITREASALSVPGYSHLAPGVAFAVPGAGIALWIPTRAGDGLSPASLVAIAPDLGSATTVSVPAGNPAFATATELGLADPDTYRLSIVNLAGTPRATLTTVCAPSTALVPNADGSEVAIWCRDGSTELLALPSLAITRLPTLSEAADPGGILSLWWDPAGGLHASTTPVLQADYTDVHDWDLSGQAWVRSSKDGVLTRTYPANAPAIRLQHGNFVDHWIVESAPEVDLGESVGNLAVAPATPATG